MSTLTAHPQTALSHEAHPVLTPEQVRFFETNGFLSLDQIVTKEEVQKCRSILDDLFRKRAGEKEGALFDTMAADSADTVPKSLELTNPMNYSSELRKTNYVRNATSLAKQLLGDGAKLASDMVILKPAELGVGTPWHQDEAYRDPRFDYHELTLWLPLQDVGLNSGCMEFIPGSHKQGIHPHRSPQNDARIHAIECAQDLSDMEIVACPLPAGGCTLHHGRTLHCTTMNRAPIARYAFILVFHIPPTPNDGNRTFSWLAEKQSARKDLKRNWILHGGVFVLAWRKFRRGDLWDLAGIRYSVKQGLRAIRKR